MQCYICKNLFNIFLYIIIYLKVAKNYTYLFRIKIKYFAFADKKKETRFNFCTIDTGNVKRASRQRDRHIDYTSRRHSRSNYGQRMINVIIRWYRWVEQDIRETVLFSFYPSKHCCLCTSESEYNVAEL